MLRHLVPRAGIEYYYYDQLGSFRSDQPHDPTLWDLARFVDEVEQVRQALQLDSSNFVLLGQSWGGILAMEYAIHHQEHLKGLVVSNMMSSARLYNAYANDVLMPSMDQSVLAEIKRFEAEGTTDDPRYEQLLMEHHYVLHVCRMPIEEWPDPVNRALAHINPEIYVPMQGPSELGLAAPSRTGTAPVTFTTSTCPRSSSVPRTTPWTRHTCAGCPSSCPRVPTSTAPKAATCPCSTTPSTTSPGWSASCSPCRPRQVPDCRVTPGLSWMPWQWSRGRSGNWSVGADWTRWPTHLPCARWSVR